MLYTITFAGFEPATADTHGYDAYEFLVSDPPSFASEAEAKAWLSANDRGPDTEGVKATWRIEVIS